VLSGSDLVDADDHALRVVAQRFCDGRIDLRLGGRGERVQCALEVDQLRDGVGVLAGGELRGRRFSSDPLFD
jgi:hypothetical protein